MPRSKPDEVFPCPNCGSDWPTSRKVCRSCGYSDEYAASDDGFLPEDPNDFDYDDFVAREFPEHAAADSPAARRDSWTRWVVLAIVASFVLGLWMGLG